MKTCKRIVRLPNQEACFFSSGSAPPASMATARHLAPHQDTSSLPRQRSQRLPFIDFTRVSISRGIYPFVPRLFLDKERIGHRASEYARCSHNLQSILNAVLHLFRALQPG